MKKNIVKPISIKIENRLIDYCLLAMRFVEGLIDKNKENGEEFHKCILDSLEFIIQLLDEIVNDFEPNEEYEQANLSLSIARAIYVPIVMYQQDVEQKIAEEIVKKELNYVITEQRNKRYGKT